MAVALIAYFSLLFVILIAPLHKLGKKKEGEAYEEDANQKIVI